MRRIAPTREALRVLIVCEIMRMALSVFVVACVSLCDANNIDVNVNVYAITRVRSEAHQHTHQ